MHILKYHIKYFSEFLYGTDFDQNRLLVIPQMPYKTANEVRVKMEVNWLKRREVLCCYDNPPTSPSALISLYPLLNARIVEVKNTLSGIPPTILEFFKL